MKAELVAAGFNNVNTRVTDTPLGETPAAGSENANFRRVDMIPDGGQPQTIAVHEFGHAFGLDDEYGAEFGAGRPAPGTPVDHDAATKKMTDSTAPTSRAPSWRTTTTSCPWAARSSRSTTRRSTRRCARSLGIEEWALGPKQARPGGPGGRRAPGAGAGAGSAGGP